MGEKNIIYHYCDVDTFYSIISNKNLRLSDVSKTNDYMEKKWAYKKVLKVFSERLIKDVFFTDRWRKVIENIYSQFPQSTLTLAACFSKNGDLLSEWIKYAKDGLGVSIGFDSNILAFGDNEFGLFKDKIIYSEIEQDKRIDEIVKKFLTEIDLSSKNEDDIESILFNKVFLSLDNICSTMKNFAFKEEEEVRIIYPVNIGFSNTADFERDSFTNSKELEVNNFRMSKIKYKSENENLILYSDLSFENYIEKGIIKEIILGPKCRLNEADIRFFLHNENYSGKVVIMRSEGTYS